jgi:hypothetical protein
MCRWSSGREIVMTPPPEEIRRRIIYILHWAWVEARARSPDSEFVFDLSDVMHNVPSLLHNYTPQHAEVTREELAKFCRKYSRPRLLELWENGVPAEDQWLWIV